MGHLIFLLSLEGQCKCRCNRIKSSLFQPGQHTHKDHFKLLQSPLGSSTKATAKKKKHIFDPCASCLSKTPTGLKGPEKTVFTLLASHRPWCKTQSDPLTTAILFLNSSCRETWFSSRDEEVVESFVNVPLSTSRELFSHIQKWFRFMSFFRYEVDLLHEGIFSVTRSGGNCHGGLDWTCAAGQVRPRSPTFLFLLFYVGLRLRPWAFVSKRLLQAHTIII